MNQNLTYSYSDPRVNQQQSQNQGLYPSTYQTTTYTTSTSAPNGYGSTTFIPNNGTIVQQGRVPQTIRIPSGGEQEEKNRNIMMDSYFLDTPTSSNWNAQTNHQTSQGIQISSQIPSSISYQNGNLSLGSSPGKTVVPLTTPKMISSSLSPDKAEKERMKKARQAEAARMRYHRLTPVQKRELNLKRTMAQKRKRQREKEMEELDSILRETNDIQEDPDITEQLREKRMRAKWAEAARQRYARMTPDERRAHNNRRRQRQMQNALNAAGGTGDPQKDEEAVRQHIKMQNAKKAEAARMRYHRMTDEEKRMYNQRRTEAFRRRRMEEEMLLAMPIGRINGEALDRAQQIVVRNAKRAEAARARYQRMTPDQRKNYNQKRYTPKRRSNGEMGIVSQSKKDEDVLTTLEREVMKRTQQAQQALKRQQGAQAAQQAALQSGNATPGPSQQQSSHHQASGSTATYIINPTPQQTVTHIPQQGGVQIQIPGTHQQVVHVSHHMQPINAQGHTIITQQPEFTGFSNPTSQSHVVVAHGNNSAPTSNHVVVQHHPQVTYTANGLTYTTTNQHVQPVQQVQQQVLNPYQPRPQ